MKILIVEDSLLVSMDLEDTLRDAGYTIVGPARNVRAAQELLERDVPDAALLDIDLDGSPSFPIADSLQERGIKFAFLTGYTHENVPIAYRSSPVLEKPFLENSLLKVVQKILPHRTLESAE